MANNNENKILNVPTKREQCQTCLGNAERAEQVTKVKPKGNVPNLRFPEFTEEWRIKTIFDACTLYNGRAYKQEELLSTGKYRVLRVGNFFTNDSWYYSNLELDDFKTVVNGDLLYAWSASFGPRFWDGEKAIYHYHIWKVIPKQHVDKFYLYHFLYKDSLIIKSRTQGGTMVHVTKGDMEKRLIQLPCIEEQKKIARLLDLIDERIATQNKIIDKLQSLIKGIGDKLLFNDTWTTTRLCDILTERIEKSKTNNQHEVLSSTVKGIYSQREYFSKDIASENNVGYKIIYLHDIVLSPQNLWMGNINYNNKFDVGIVSPSYKIYKVSSKFDKHFIASILKTHRALYNYQLVSEQGASVVRRNLNMEAFEQLTFKMPPYDLQVKIGLVISLLQKQLDIAFATKQVYDQQKQYLLSQIFI